MDFKLATLLIALALILGVVGGYAVAPESEIKVVTLPGETVVSETIIEVEVADTSLLLDQAVSDFLNEVADENDLRRCDGDKYSITEISQEDVDNEYDVSIDGEDYTVEFEIELRYKESDLRSCYEDYRVSAEYEEDEDVVITVD